MLETIVVTIKGFNHVEESYEVHTEQEGIINEYTGISP